MKTKIIKGLLWAYAAAAICTSQVAHAEKTEFEKLVEQRALERAAKQARVDNQPVLNQADVDRLLIAIPKINNTVKQLDLPAPNEEQIKQMNIAAAGGNPTATMANILGGTSALSELDQESAEMGYQNYAHYAEHFDIAFAVLSAEGWVLMARDMVRDGEEKPQPIDNLWSYILDESNPASEREKLRTQLNEILPRSGAKPQNAEIIYRNYDALKPLVAPPQ